MIKKITVFALLISVWFPISNIAAQESGKELTNAEKVLLTGTPKEVLAQMNEGIINRLAKEYDKSNYDGMEKLAFKKGRTTIKDV